MKYPENLKKGDVIGICAPSGGIAEEVKQKKLDIAIKNLQEMGFRVKETESVRKEERGRSASGEQRAKELMELLKDDEVKLILCACGGDFLLEMLDYLDLEEVKKLPPKWIQGFSDITGLGFLWNEYLDIPSIYCDTIKSYAMKPLYKNLENALCLAQGKIIEQESFEKCEKVIDFREELNSELVNNSEMENEEIEQDEDLYKGYDLTESVEWKNLFGEEKIKIKGRCIGGCLDVVREFIGTKYDRIKEYIEKYKNDGIIWFLECFEMSTPELYRTLWQMKNAGYFKNCNGIIFGRPLFIRNDYDIDFNQTVKEVCEDLKIPIICDADIGHVAPQMAIVNGAVLEISSQNGKGLVKTYFR